MQQRLEFNNQSGIELAKPIKLTKLKECIKNYCRKLCPSNEVALSAYNLIETELDLDRAVDIINKNDLSVCENELTNIIRPRIVVFISYYAFVMENEKSAL